MKLNALKTTEIKICFKKTQPSWDSIVLEGQEIVPVRSAKLLGFTINDQCNWKDHVDVMIKKVNKRLFFLRAMIRTGFCKTDIIAFYVASVRSVLEYGSPLWHYSISQELNTKIENIQRRVIKMIEGIPHSNHWYDYEGILRNFKLKTLEERRIDLCREYIIKIASDMEHPLHNRLKKKKTSTE